MWSGGSNLCGSGDTCNYCPKEVEFEGSRVWWRLKVEGPNKVNVCGCGTLATVVQKKWSEMWDYGRWGN